MTEDITKQQADELNREVERDLYNKAKVEALEDLKQTMVDWEVPLSENDLSVINGIINYKIFLITDDTSEEEMDEVAGMW